MPLLISVNAVTYSHAESVTNSTLPSKTFSDVSLDLTTNDYSPSHTAPARPTGYPSEDKLSIILVAEVEADTPTEPPGGTTTYTYGKGAGEAESPGGTTTYTYGKGAGETESPGGTTTYTYGKGAGKKEPPPAVTEPLEGKTTTYTYDKEEGKTTPPPAVTEPLEGKTTTYTYDKEGGKTEPAAGETSPPTEPPPSVSGCVTCHKKTADKVAAYTVKHSDIVIRKCELCHMTSRGTGVPVRVYADAHLIVLNGLLDDSAYSVLVSIKDAEGRESRSETLKITPGLVTEYLVNNSALPVIGNLRLVRVDVRIFTEAVVEWETDKFASSTVEYGLTEKYGAEVTSPYFVKGHSVKLPGLKSGKLYHYRVKVIDPFGNTAVSADRTIDTSKTLGGTGAPAGPGPEFKSIKFTRFVPEGSMPAAAPEGAAQAPAPAAKEAPGQWADIRQKAQAALKGVEEADKALKGVKKSVDKIMDTVDFDKESWDDEAWRKRLKRSLADVVEDIEGADEEVKNVETLLATVFGTSDWRSTDWREAFRKSAGAAGMGTGKIEEVLRGVEGFVPYTGGDLKKLKSYFSTPEDGPEGPEEDRLPELMKMLDDWKYGGDSKGALKVMNELKLSVASLPEDFLTSSGDYASEIENFLAQKAGLREGDEREREGMMETIKQMRAFTSRLDSEGRAIERARRAFFSSTFDMSSAESLVLSPEDFTMTTQDLLNLIDDVEKAVTMAKQEKPAEFLKETGGLLSTMSDRVMEEELDRVGEVLDDMVELFFNRATNGPPPPDDLGVLIGELAAVEGMGLEKAGGVASELEELVGEVLERSSGPEEAEAIINEELDAIFDDISAGVEGARKEKLAAIIKEVGDFLFALTDKDLDADEARGALTVKLAAFVDMGVDMGGDKAAAIIKGLEEKVAAIPGVVYKAEAKKSADALKAMKETLSVLLVKSDARARAEWKKRFAAMAAAASAADSLNPPDVDPSAALKGAERFAASKGGLEALKGLKGFLEIIEKVEGEWGTHIERTDLGMTIAEADRLTGKMEALLKKVFSDRHAREFAEEFSRAAGVTVTPEEALKAAEGAFVFAEKSGSLKELQGFFSVLELAGVFKDKEDALTAKFRETLSGIFSAEKHKVDEWKEEFTKLARAAGVYQWDAYPALDAAEAFALHGGDSKDLKAFLDILKKIDADKALGKFDVRSFKARLKELIEGDGAAVNGVKGSLESIIGTAAPKKAALKKAAPAPAPRPVILPDKRVGIIITTNTRVKATLEVAKQPDPTKKHNEWELKDLRESGMKSCYECHKVGTSHPVNIPALRVPAELPTAKGRVMVCATCHRPHGGDIEFMLRYDQRNKICVLCHTNM